VRVKERERGYDEATMVESFVVLNAVGGEGFDDFQRLREDPGFSEMRGHGIPCPEQRIATVGQDATIIESRKQEALRSYAGELGYPPMLAVWAETNVGLADEFRDGNLPPMGDPLRVAKKAFAWLPETVTTFSSRNRRTPRGVKRKTSNFPLRPRGIKPLSPINLEKAIRILK